MKRILFMALLCLPAVIMAQNSEPSYDYELLPTSKTQGIDTVYQAILIVDSTSVTQFKKIAVLNNNKERTFNFKDKIFSKDPNITLSAGTYRIELGEWSNIDNWIVFGEKEDKSKSYLTSKHKKDWDGKEKKSKLIHTAIPIDYSKRKDSSQNQN